MKRLIKSAYLLGLRLLYASGLLWWYARRVLRDRIVVFTYHRVLPADAQRRSFSSSAIVVSPETFERHMAWLKRAWRPVTLARFNELLAGGEPIPAGTCLVTFDDGWYDNLEHALPVLERHGVPATIFVATNYIGTGACFWQERGSRLLALLCRARAGAALSAVGAGELLALPAGQLRGAIRARVDAWKNLQPAQIDALLAQLEAALPPAANDTEAGAADRFMGWSEVQRLAASGLVTIGSHAMTHTPLTKQPIETSARELAGARAIIARELGLVPTALAYPNGDCDLAVAGAAADAGYAAAFTTVPGHVTLQSRPLALPRLNVHDGLAREDALLGRIVGLL